VLSSSIGPWESSAVRGEEAGSKAPGGLLDVLVLAVAGVGLASLPRGAGVPGLLIGGIAGAACAVWTGRAAGPDPPSPTRRDAIERIARALPVLFLAPALTMPVAPGADMAMHTALARGLREGAAELSRAWPGVAPAVYPRGFSALVALLWDLGAARAGLLASGLAYVVFALGAARAFAATGIARPHLLAALVLFLAKAPQEFFAWGGNPTVLAVGLGLHAAAHLAAPSGDWRRPAPAAGLLLAGAAAVHPMGALVGALAAAALAVRARRVRAGVVAVAAMGTVLALLAVGGPHLSGAERQWIVDWGRGREAVLRTPAWQFPVGVWLALPRTLGVPWTAVTAVAAAGLLGQATGRALVARAGGAVLAIGALFAALPLVPALGLLLYPVRLLPLLPLATAPLLDAALVRLGPRRAAVAGLLLLAAAAPGHVAWYQRARPMATAADLRVLRCAGLLTPADAVIAGAYGDATQWVPALLGRRITLPHRHVSVLDETGPPLDALRPTHRLSGERRRYASAFPGPEPGPEPATAPLCVDGAARLWRLDG
jgi:hypothetical protein